MLFSISEYNGRVRFGDSAYYFKKQLFATALGLLAMYVVAEDRLPASLFGWPRLPIFLPMGLSTAVLLVGQEINGSKRWLNFGPLSFQPSEFAKVAVILVSGLADLPDSRTENTWILVYVQDYADTSSHCRTGGLQ